MTTTHRLARLVAVLTMLALVLVACGGEQTTAPAGVDTADDATEPTDPADTDEATDAPTESDDPIRVGGSLALSGPLASTGGIHEIAGEQFIEDLNAQGGLLGREVEWVLFDDESSPETSAALYERLITEEDVDLLIGPYGTGNITAAMQVAERHQMVFPHHTASLVYAYEYEWHLPTWQVGLNTSETTPTIVYEAYLQTEDPPETVGFVIDQFPGTDFLAYGHEDASGAVGVAEEMGLEVVLDVQFTTGNTDWGPIAQRVAEADPDLLYMGTLGVDGPNLLAALAQIGYTPRHHFYQWPAPGPFLAAGEIADGATSVTLFEPYEPFLSNPGAATLVEEYTAAAEEAGLDYTVPETQAAASWAAWQLLAAGVEGCQCLDQAEIADYLLNNTTPTVVGDIEFDAEQQNYGEDQQKVKQIQDGDWYVVYPEEWASEGRSIR